MKKLLLPLCLILSSSCETCAQTSKEYKTAMSYFQLKQYPSAGVQFLKAMQAEPKNPKPIYYSGYCLYMSGRKEDAVKTFWHLVDTIPNSTEAGLAREFLKRIDRNYNNHSKIAVLKSDNKAGAITKSELQSADFYIGKLIVVHPPRGKYPPVSMSYTNEIRRLLKGLPVTVLKALTDNKAKISILPSIVERDFRMQNTVPRGWDEGTSWQNSTAFCQGTEVVISQYRIDRRTGDPVETTDEVGVIRHEVGHALDHCLDISDSEEFKHAYRLEAARVPQEMRRKLDYYLQSGDGGPSETFAELFNDKYGGYTDSGRGNIASQVKTYFPNCNKILEQKLKALESQ